MLKSDRESVRMLKITNDSLPGLEQDASSLYPCGSCGVAVKGLTLKVQL